MAIRASFSLSAQPGRGETTPPGNHKRTPSSLTPCRPWRPLGHAGKRPRAVSSRSLIGRPRSATPPQSGHDTGFSEQKGTDVVVSTIPVTTRGRKRSVVSTFAHRRSLDILAGRRSATACPSTSIAFGDTGSSPICLPRTPCNAVPSAVMISSRNHSR